MMNLRISWGWKIAGLYSGFVIMILVMVWKSTTKKIDLVADDYYEQELLFQHRIDQSKRAASLAEPLKWSVSGAQLLIQYPAEFSGSSISGEVRFYCPADNRKDTSFPIAADGKLQQVIPFRKLQPGRYLLQIDWKAGGKSYWNEGVIRI